MKKESNNQNRTIRITESEIKDMVRESVELILSEGHIYKPVAYNKTITLNNGVKQKALVTLSDGAGAYHIGIDDGCYVIHQENEDGTMQDESTMYIFPELHKALKNLPNLPLH